MLLLCMLVTPGVLMHSMCVQCCMELVVHPVQSMLVLCMLMTPGFQTQSMCMQCCNAKIMDERIVSAHS